MRHVFESNDDLSNTVLKPLARPEVERHPRPAPGVDLGLERNERFRRAVRRDTRLVESKSGPPRKYYRLTPAGRTAYAAQKREWRSFTEAVNQLLGDTR